MRDRPFPQARDYSVIALENAQLFQEREQRITELSILNEVARDLTSTLDAPQLLERMSLYLVHKSDAPDPKVYGPSDFQATFAAIAKLLP